MMAPFQPLQAAKAPSPELTAATTQNYQGCSSMLRGAGQSRHGYRTGYPKWTWSARLKMYHALPASAQTGDVSVAQEDKDLRPSCILAKEAAGLRVIRFRAQVEKEPRLKIQAMQVRQYRWSP